MGIADARRTRGVHDALCALLCVGVYLKGPVRTGGPFRVSRREHRRRTGRRTHGRHQAPGRQASRDVSHETPRRRTVEGLCVRRRRHELDRQLWGPVPADSQAWLLPRPGEEAEGHLGGTREVTTDSHAPKRTFPTWPDLITSTRTFHSAFLRVTMLPSSPIRTVSPSMTTSGQAEQDGQSEILSMAASLLRCAGRRLRAVRLRRPRC